MYTLMWKDTPVVRFDTKRQTGEFVNESLIRSEQNVGNSSGSISPYEFIRNFCSTRVLMMNRRYSKEILTSCGINDQSPINICIIGKGLSFRDNYWIKEDGSTDTWESVNLYKNPFSREISITALTGESTSVHMGDTLYTGELTNLGTRTKCIIRYGESILLAKQETSKEIAAEVLSSVICEALGIKATTYIGTEVYDKYCSVCALQTSEHRELCSCRDILQFLKSDMNCNSNYYRYMMENFYLDFIKMHIFDYIILNTDRNRDNFGLEYIDNNCEGMYPLYDHDSCFKGLSDNALYFVTGTSFKNTIGILKERYTLQYKKVIDDTWGKWKEFRVIAEDVFNDAGLHDKYIGFRTRVSECFK